MPPLAVPSSLVSTTRRRRRRRGTPWPGQPVLAGVASRPGAPRHPAGRSVRHRRSSSTPRSVDLVVQSPAVSARTSSVPLEAARCTASNTTELGSPPSAPARCRRRPLGPQAELLPGRGPEGVTAASRTGVPPPRAGWRPCHRGGLAHAVHADEEPHVHRAAGSPRPVPSSAHLRERRVAVESMATRSPSGRRPVRRSTDLADFTGPGGRPTGRRWRHPTSPGSGLLESSQVAASMRARPAPSRCSRTADPGPCQPAAYEPARLGLGTGGRCLDRSLDVGAAAEAEPVRRSTAVRRRPPPDVPSRQPGRAVGRDGDPAAHHEHRHGDDHRQEPVGERVTMTRRHRSDAVPGASPKGPGTWPAGRRSDRPVSTAAVSTRAGLPGRARPAGRCGIPGPPRRAGCSSRSATSGRRRALRRPRRREPRIGAVSPDAGFRSAHRRRRSEDRGSGMPGRPSSMTGRPGRSPGRRRRPDVARQLGHVDRCHGGDVELGGRPGAEGLDGRAVARTFWLTTLDDPPGPW